MIAGTTFDRVARWVPVHPDSLPIKQGTRPGIVTSGPHRGWLREPADETCVPLPAWAGVTEDERADADGGIRLVPVETPVRPRSLL